MEVKPHPVTPEYFSDRIESVPVEESKAMHAELAKQSIIDAAGFLQTDLR